MGHHGRDDEASTRLVGLDEAQRLDEIATEADLLLRLPQRSRQRTSIESLDLAAGKGDLTRVRGQMSRALGQQHVETGAGTANDDRNEHGRGA